MTKVEDEQQHASVEIGCGNILGCDDGVEEHHPAEIGGNGTEKGVIVGSVVAGGEFPVEKSNQDAREILSSDLNASTVLQTKLTIFFGRSVSVFDGIPPEKVQEIIRMATAAAKAIETKNSTSISPVPSAALNRAPSFSSTSNAASPAVQSFSIQPTSFCRSAADLPIARRHSLQRFLEKRRDRVVSRNPYPVSVIKKTDFPTDNASVKEESPTT